MKKIWNLSRKYHFKIIEDASHALEQNIMIQISEIVDLVIFVFFSFHPIKSITTFEGGAITTNSKSIYDFLNC